MRPFRAAVAMLLVAAVAHAANEIKPPASEKVFYVYADKGDKRNHFIPSGWMGDYGDLKLDDQNKEDPADGKTAIKWTYNATAKQGANWTGVYWQIPANNWGEKPGGFDLTGYKRLTFWVKADTNAKIATFKVGGITGEHGDSDSVEIGPIDVTKKWTKQTIDLAGRDLRHIIGGFCWSASRDDNPTGFNLYLDEIRFEK